MASREYLLIEGARYRVVPGTLQLSTHAPTFRRVAGAVLEQSVVRTPFDAWAQVGIEDGEGVERSEEGQVTGYASSSAVVPDVDGLPFRGHARATLAPAVETVNTWAGRGAVTALAVFGGDLYVGFSASPVVAAWDGAAWADAFNTGKGAGTGVLCLEVLSGALYVGTDVDGALLKWDGTTLSTAVTEASSDGITALGLAYVGGSTRLYYAWRLTTGSQRAQLSYWDGAAGAAVGQVQEKQVYGLTWHDGLLYLAAGMAADQWGALYELDPSAASSLRPAAPRLVGTFPVSVAVFGGAVYAGYAWGGVVAKLADADLGVVAQFGASAPPASMPGDEQVRALYAVGDRLYAAGKSLSSGKAWVRSLERGGWHLVAELSDADWVAPGALGRFGGLGRLLVGTGDGTDAVLLQLAESDYASTGAFTSPEWDGGLPNVPKSYVRATVNHAALAAGESMAVYARIDGGAETLLLTSDTDGATSAEATFAATAKGKRLQLRHVLSGPGTSAPTWISTVVDWKAAPTPKTVLRATLLLEDGPKWWDRSADTRTAEAQRAALYTLRVSDQALSVTHVDGVTAWTMRFPERDEDEVLLQGGLDSGSAGAYRWPLALVEQ